MLIGYMRPYHEDPTCEKQSELMTEFHCEKVIMEEHSSAKKRAHLTDMINDLQSGDKIIILKLFALADSSLHLVEILEMIEGKGAFIHSIKEGIDTSDAGGYQFSVIIKHLVEFQRDVISEKTKQGLRHAQEKGVSPGRPRKPDENVQRAIIMYESKKYSLAEIREETGISKTTLYRYLES